MWVFCIKNDLSELRFVMRERTSNCGELDSARETEVYCARETEVYCTRETKLYCVRETGLLSKRLGYTAQ